jgi:F-type H+-transporting ATPase subunit delta
VKNILAAQRYSHAIIYELTAKEINSILADIEIMSSTIKNESEFVNTVNSYLYPIDKRIELALEVSKRMTNKKIWNNLFNILIKKHRFNIIPAILIDLENEILASKNQVKVELSVAHQLPDNLLDSISIELKKILEKDIILKTKIDPEILGGFVATTDSLIIDGSIKNHLIKLLKMKSKNRK